MNGIAVPGLERVLGGAPVTAAQATNLAESPVPQAVAVPASSVQAWMAQLAQHSTVQGSAAVPAESESADAESSASEIANVSELDAWVQPLPAMQMWMSQPLRGPAPGNAALDVADVRPRHAPVVLPLDPSISATGQEQMVRGKGAVVPIASASGGDVGTVMAPSLAEAPVAVSGTLAAVRGMANGVSITQSAVSESVPVQQGSQALVQSLAQRVQVQHLQGTQVAVVRLDPPQMGTIELRISHDATGVHVQMQASHSEVGRQLVAVVDSLRQELLTRSGDAHITVSSSRSTSTGGQSDAQRQATAWDAEPEIGQALQGEQHPDHA